MAVAAGRFLFLVDEEEFEEKAEERKIKIFLPKNSITNFSP